MMNDELTESQENWLLQIRTEWRRGWWRRFLLRAREENQHIVVPPNVDAMRNFNDTLHRIEKNTAESHGFLSALFSGLGQAVAERKAKKK